MRKYILFTIISFSIGIWAINPSIVPAQSRIDSLTNLNDQNNIHKISFDSLEVKEIIKLIAESQKVREEKKNNLFIILDFIKSYWIILAFVGTLIGLGVAWKVYNISFLQPFEQIYFKQQEYYNKQEEYQLKRKQQKLKRDLITIFNALGDSLLNVNLLNAAKIEFQKSVTLNALDNRSQMGVYKSEIFEPIEKGNYNPELMEKRLSLFLDKYPQDIHIYSFYGNFYMYINDNIKAISSFERAIEINPACASAYQGLGIIYDLRNNTDSALVNYEKSWELSKFNESYLNNLAHKYYELNNLDKAVHYYEQLLNVNNQYMLAYYSLSNAYLKKGMTETALKRLQTLVQLFESESVLKQSRNKEHWFFHIDDMDVWFIDFDKKKYYAYVLLALSFSFINLPGKAVIYLQRAVSFYKDVDSSIEQLIKYNIDKITGYQPNKENQISVFLEAMEKAKTLHNIK